MNRIPHNFIKCFQPGPNQESCDDCPACKGLAICSVCQCAEGTLLSSCPGYLLSAEAEQSIYQGNVIDFEWMKACLMNGWNPRTGRGLSGGKRK